MTLDPRTGGASSPTPALGVGDEYSRGFPGGEHDLSAALRVLSALAQAGDPAAAIAAALDACAGEQGLGFTRALLFLVDESSGTLAGREMVGADADARREALRRLRLPIDLAADHPLVRALHDCRPGPNPLARENRPLGEVLPAEEETRPLLTIPLGEADARLGVLVLEEASAARAETDVTRLALAVTIAVMLGAQLSAEGARERGALQAARAVMVAGAVRLVLRMTNLPDVLVHTARTGQRLTQSRCALLWTASENGDELSLAVHLPAERHDSLEAWRAELEKLARLCLQHNTTMQYPDLRREEAYDLEALPEASAAIFLPLGAFGDSLGVLALVRTGISVEGVPYSGEEEGWLTILGGYAAVAMKNAQLGDRARETQAQVRETQATLAHLQRLATLGEQVGGLADELRNPIIAIVGLARTIERELAEDDPNREYARVILREARRMEERVSEQRALAGPLQPRLTLQPLNLLVRACVDELRDDTERRSVLVEEIYSEQIPELLLDGERIQQAVRNILRRALDGLHEGDTLRVESLRQSDYALVEIAHTGPRLTGEVLEELFVPFAAAQPSGPGLGLALAYEIVKQHGGEISVRSAGEWAAIYTLSLPLEENRERRRRGERRGRRDRRDRNAERG
jgi:signal transduction histidine kinase